MTTRADLSRPLTPAELKAAHYLSQGLTYRQLAEVLGISPRTAKQHIINAAAKIPGDLPLQLRVITWYRGGESWTIPEDASSV